MNIRGFFMLSVSIVWICFFTACRQDGKNSTNEATTTDAVEEVKNSTPVKTTLPDPCAAVSKADIARLLSKSEDKITYKSGSSPSSTTRSCFYRWTDATIPNAAILLQALGNPVPDEFTGWAAAFIENKKSNGERLLSDPDTPIKYVTLKGVGDHTCYNLKESKCYFRLGDIVYLVATNGIDDDDVKMSIFRTLGNIILDSK